MSISNLFHPNDYNLFGNSINTFDVEGINSVLNIGTNTTETTRINIGNGPSNPTPVYIDGHLYNPTPFISSIGPILNTPNNNGCVDTGGVFSLCTTSSTQGGVFYNGNQTFPSGTKTFSNDVVVNNGDLYFNFDGGFRILDDLGGVPFISNNGDSQSVYIGRLTGNNNTGTFNTCCGAVSLVLGQSGSYNICLGNRAGQNMLTTESSNIMIGSVGVTGDNNQIRIGTQGSGNGQQTQCQIAGIYGNSPSSSQVVVIDSNGNLGSTSSSLALTVGPINPLSTPNGMDITGSVISLHVADQINGGVVSNTAQSFAGDKTFTNNLNSSENITVPDSLTSAIGNIKVGNVFLHNHASGLNHNLFLGLSAGNYTNVNANRNTGVGANVFNSLTNGSNNTIIGGNSGTAISNGAGNTICGALSGTVISNGNQNTIVGFQAECGPGEQHNVIMGYGAGGVSSGSTNVLLGYNTGVNVGSNNVEIATTGITSENNQIRIGTQGTHTNCQIAGIYSNSPSSPQMVIIDSSGNLGSQAIPSSTLTVGPITNVPNSNGMDITSGVISLHACSVSTGGVINTTNQVIAGQKTFNDPMTANQGINCFGSLNMDFSPGNGIYDNTSSEVIFQTHNDITNLYIGGNSGLLNTTGNHNTAYGSLSLSGSGQTGSYNIALGFQAGSSLTTTNSSNILIGSNGVSGDNNTIRIGTQGGGSGQQQIMYIEPLKTASFPVSIDPNNHFMTTNSVSGQTLALNNYFTDIYSSSGGASFTLSSGTVNAMTIRGVSLLAPFKISCDAWLMGVMVTIRIPAFTVTSATLPSGSIVFNTPMSGQLFPTSYNFSVAVNVVNSGLVSNSACDIVVNTSGIISINFDGGGAYVTPFGFQNDIVFSYFAF